MTDRLDAPTKRKIVIFDDMPEAAAHWRDEIQRIEEVSENFSIEAVDKERFVNAAKALELRRYDVRKKRPIESEGEATLFDEADIIIVDYDLLDVAAREQGRDYLTGEGVAYLARCFSKCGYIVALNQFGRNTFDLTMKGHPTSYADLNVGSDQINCVGLWVQNGPLSFRPWSWPLLPRAAVAYQDRVSELKKRLDEPILPFLGFTPEVAQRLPRESLEFLDVGGKGAEDAEMPSTTFREFVLKSVNGFRYKDGTEFAKYEDVDFLEDQLARLAAARIAKWLDRIILPSQDVLVDAPHLVSRYPSLLDGDPTSITALNSTTNFDKPPVADLVSLHSFKKSQWMSRPVWWGREVAVDPNISEVVDPWSAQLLSASFCEDISAFLPVSMTRDFVADLATPYDTRHVVDIDGLTDEYRDLADGLRGVEYRPRIRFAL